MQEADLARMGQRLRRIPGARFALEARIAFRDRRARHSAERREAELVARDRAWVKSLAGRRDLRLNIGSSSEHVAGWISVDLVRDPRGECMRFDATRPWPFESGSAEAVNSEHMLEHLDPADAPRFFSEAMRVLRPGGLMRTSTPDLRGICEAYLTAAPRVLDIHRRSGYEARNHADMLNNYLRMHGHRHVYDFETLQLLLADAGFEQIERVAFGESRHAVLRGVDTHDLGELAALTVAVDAVKPAAPSTD